MKDISTYIFEGKIETLQDYINRGIITDRNFNDILRYAKETSGSRFINEQNFKKILKNKGIYNVKWDIDVDAGDWIIDLFMRNNCEGTLNKITADDGLYTIDDLSGGKNLFNDFCSDFIEPAKQLAYKKVSGSANAGQYELLLKLILKNVVIRKKGDVNLSDGELEVKACGRSGAHAAGQQGIGPSGDIYFILDKFCFNPSDEDDNSRSNRTNELTFLTNKGVKQKKNGPITGIDTFYEAVKGSGLEEEYILKCLFLGILYQYRVTTNIHVEDVADILNGNRNIGGNIGGDLDKLYNNFNKYLNGVLKQKESTAVNRIFDAIGAVQLYLYCIGEKFNRFIIAYLNGDKYNDPRNGDYHLFTNPKKDFLDIKNTIQYIEFGPLDNATTTYGRTGKMYLR